jgi:hypothetical protein
VEEETEEETENKKEDIEAKNDENAEKLKLRQSKKVTQVDNHHEGSASTGTKEEAPPASAPMMRKRKAEEVAAFLRLTCSREAMNAKKLQKITQSIKAAGKSGLRHRR